MNTAIIAIAAIALSLMSIGQVYAQTDIDISEEVSRKFFYNAGLEHEQLRQDLAEALHCELYTKCHMVYAGNGFIQIMIESGNEDDYNEDFIGLAEAKEIQAQFIQENQ